MFLSIHSGQCNYRIDPPCLNIASWKVKGKEGRTESCRVGDTRPPLLVKALHVAVRMPDLAPVSREWPMGEVPGYSVYSVRPGKKKDGLILSAPKYSSF